MLKQTASLLLSLLLACALTVSAAAEENPAGFDYSVGYTDTKNEYYFQGDMSVAIVNKEVLVDPFYEWLPPGAQILLPIYVYPDNERNSIPATDKMLKTDNVTVSSKIMTGKAHVGEITVVDSKNLKLDDLTAGMYVSIPLTKDYEKVERTIIRADFVLSVNDVTYDLTTISLKCYIKNPVTEIPRNSIYGAKTPTLFKVAKDYNGEATFDFGGGVNYTARLKGDESYYLNLDKTPDSGLEAMYPEAHLDFYNFIGDRDAFQSNGRLEIPVNRDDFRTQDDNSSIYAYKVQNNKLVALGTGVVSFDAKDDTLAIRTSKLESYVLSNQALAQDISASPDSDILKAGYADLAAAETSQVSGASEAQPASQPSTPAPAPSLADVDDDGYVPEEPSYYNNDNLSMGLPITALNISADNPSTSERSALPAAFAYLLISLTSLAVICKRP